jgi:hypothetical protein
MVKKPESKRDPRGSSLTLEDHSCIESVSVSVSQSVRESVNLWFIELLTQLKRKVLRIDDLVRKLTRITFKCLKETCVPKNSAHVDVRV